MGRGTQCFKQWLRDHCECTRRVCGCAACGQNHEFGTPCSWRVYMLLLLLLCDARNNLLCVFWNRILVHIIIPLGFMWVCTTSLSPACILRSAPRRVVVFSHSSFIATLALLFAFVFPTRIRQSFRRFYWLWLCRLLCGCRLFVHACSSFVWWWPGMWPWHRWRIGCRNKMKNFEALLPCMRH